MKPLQTLIALLALCALFAGGMHGAAMATASPVAAADAAPCHDSEPAKPAKSDCCANGCDGQCTASGAFFAAPASRVIAFFRAVLDAPAKAEPVSAFVARSERPPKS